MSMELVKKSIDVPVARMQNGQLIFTRFTVLSGVRLFYEQGKESNKDFIRISLDEFARTFHNVSSKKTRHASKDQMRRLRAAMIEDGYLVLSEYEGRELSGLIWVRNVPDKDSEGIRDLITDRIEIQRRQKDTAGFKVEQLEAIVRYVLGNDDADS